MKLIDADAMKQTFCAECNHSIKCDDCDIDYHFTHAPTVDAVEVVRCKDCYYCATEKSFDKEYLYCDAFYEHAEGDLIGVSLMVEPNHYCAWGERRKDGKIG